MTNPRQLLESHELHPKKSLGQNFLHDPNALQKILDVAEVGPDDVVIEVGTGTGALTTVLAGTARRVITFEVDDRLMPILDSQLAPYPNVELHWQDILDADIAELVEDEAFKVVANVPYYITSAIVRKVLEAQPKPTSVTLTIQKEVADRMIATPPDAGLLSVSVQFYGKPKIATRLPPSVFWPRPDVDSAVVRIDVHPQPILEVPSDDLFFEVVRAGFSQKRKQLKNALSSGLHQGQEVILTLLTAADIQPQRRAETLTLEEWARLARAYAASQAG